MTQCRMLTLAGARGGSLTARLDLPDEEPAGAVLVAHCFCGGNAGPAAAQTARSFGELGLAVLSLEFAQADRRDGEQAGAAFGSDFEDLVVAADQLRATVAPPSILVGHSLGGAAFWPLRAGCPRHARW